MNDEVTGPTEEEIKHALLWADRFLTPAKLDQKHPARILAAAYRREKAKVEELENIGKKLGVSNRAWLREKERAEAAEKTVKMLKRILIELKALPHRCVEIGNCHYCVELNKGLAITEPK